MKKKIFDYSYFIATVIASVLMYFYLNFILRLTCRTDFVKTKELQYLLKMKSSFLISLWHGDIIGGLAIHHLLAKGYKKSVLISRNKDGALAYPLCFLDRIKIFFGSSNKMQTKDLRKIIKFLSKNKRLLIITPDGPRGPRMTVNYGIAQLADMLNIPIFHVAVAYTKKITFKSWDRMYFPLPFGKRYVRFLGPVPKPEINKDVSRAIRVEKYRQSLENFAIAKSQEAMSILKTEIIGQGEPKKNQTVRYKKNIKL